jgi:DNA-binding FadR family transcriptional regulator
VMQDLKQRRLITQTVGSGTYVSHEVQDALGAMMSAAGAQAVSPAELMSARLLLEPALVDMVVGNATAADFARMEECNRHAEAATTLEAFEQWDAALHESIAAASHNRFMVAQGAWGVLKRRSATPERRLAYQQEHRALVAALQQRDAERARALCLAHLLHVRRNLLGD